MKKLLGIAVILLFQACVSFPKADPNQLECKLKPGEDDPRTKTRADVVSVKVVRFTEDGEFVSRCDYSDMLYELKRPGPQIVVMYVHGWKHNGNEDDEDLVKFKDQLDAIRLAEVNERTVERARRVVGVYVAWNGKKTEFPVAKELTFWGRKRAADRVSQSAAVTKVLGAIDSIRTTHGEPDDLTVLAGHSFGARILYNAVSQVLIYKTELAHPGSSGRPYAIVKGVGDMVLLLNPAFEASLFNTLASLRRDIYPFDPAQRPLLMSISSVSDRATRVAFPIGQALSGNRAPRRRQTLGNYQDFTTHRLVARGSVNETGSATPICSERVCMQSLTPGDKTRVPFLSVLADSSIMDGHNDIWNEDIMEFLAHVVGNLRTDATVKPTAGTTDKTTVTSVASGTTSQQ